MLRALVPNHLGTRDHFQGRQFFHRYSGVGGGMAQAVMQAIGAEDEASLTGPPLTTCCAVCFLIDEAEGPWLRGKLDIEMLDHAS